MLRTWRRLILAVAMTLLAVGAAPPQPATAQGTADIFVSLSGPSTIVTGGLISYSVTLGDAGPDNATNVLLSDPLPPGTTFQPAQSSPCWQLSGGVLTCATAAGAHAVENLVLGLTAPSSPGTVVDAVGISASQTDPNLADNTATWTTDVEPPPALADVSIGISPNPTTAVVGDRISILVEVANSGPADATGVVAVVDLPPSLVDTGDISLATGCSRDPSSGVVTCDLGSIAPNSSLPIPFQVQATAFGTFTLSASVTANEPDPDTANNSSSATITVIGNADLGLSLQAPGQVLVRSVITYSLAVTNAGPDDARNTVLTDNLPSITTLTGFSSSQGSCLNPSVGVVTCALGTLASGSTTTVTVTAFAFTDGTATNSASVTSDNPDRDTSNNVASTTTTVLPVSDLTVMLSTGPTARQGGKAAVTFTGTVTNFGPSGAPGVSATHVFATTVKNVDVASVSSSQGTCSVVAGNVACRLGTLPTGGQATVAVTLTVWGTGEVTDVFSATATDIDLFPGNNSATATVIVS